MEEAIMQLGGGFVALLLQLDNIIRGDSCHVESLRPDVNRRRFGKYLEDPQRTDRGGPGVAKDRLVFAVQKSGMRRTWCQSPFLSSFVECSLDPSTMA